MRSVSVVLIRRGERYRLYPTPAQEARLCSWGDALRFLWNAAHAQRLAMGQRCRVDRRPITAFDQINELPALRTELPWLADVPHDVCAQLLMQLDIAWRRFFDSTGGRPRFKRKGRERAPCVAPKSFRVEGEGRRGAVVFPKLGRVRTVVHRALRGRAKQCAIVLDAGDWFAAVSQEIDIADPTPSMKPPVAIDRGVVTLLADSNGTLVPNPRHGAKLQQRLARAQRSVARKKKGSNNQRKARAKVARIQRRARRQREHTLHVLSSHYAKNHGVVILEALQVKSMTRSAKGTVESPGTHVRAKSSLNRSILDAGWGRFGEMLEYKVVPEGGRVLEVPAAYSSQTCRLCGVVDPASRVTQALFRCTACGHTEHADTHASKVLLARGISVLAVEPTVTGCGGIAARGRPSKQQLCVVRRTTRHD